LNEQRTTQSTHHYTVLVRDLLNFMPTRGRAL
jgi:hypothetical protein